ncbi:hypothetical protein [uncultured Winogradskyella sp.]|uniref:hypothetical protein n=1 Tax=uncultured Winogradskyella sp. TaxID=395353 RepID=UPI00260F184D|nr:hypothetical protein [uncultured Winogradskyella sp.]
MHHFLKLILLLLLCTSCATLVNGKTTRVTITAPTNTRVEFNNGTSTVEDGTTEIFPKRTKDSLVIKLSNGSISNDFKFPRKTSPAIFFNLFIPYSFGAGFLVDLTNQKRFTYQKHLYFQIDSSTNTFYIPKKKALRFNKNDIFIYTTPLKAIDAFSQPMLTIGAEYFFADRMSISGEYGTVYTDRLGGEPDFKLVENKGRMFRYELKYYNLVNVSSNPRINEYIGLEARFLRYQFNDDLRFTRTNEDISYFVRETFAVQKSIDVFNLKYGINFPIGKRLYLDLYSGFGLRFVEIKNPNRNYNPETDVLDEDIDGYFLNFRRSNIQGVDDGTEFNFTLGFKFGIKF